jgi:CHASE2 domain-containing sensor protein
LLPERRRRAVRIACGIAAAGAAVALLCAVLAFVSVWFVVVGTGACAVTAGAAFYAAFEGFDAWLRRRR